ncbi:MAG: insulinase family protein [Thermoplasmata archaeon]|nr:insulinase family protein [Thermoplasmata archaeon]
MPPSVGFPGPLQRVRLRNGLDVILAADRQSPTVSAWIWYRVGSVNERPGITGVSHWVEHMMFQGSPHFRKGEIDRAIFAVGGTSNAFTDNDFTAYFATVPKQHFEVPLRIELDRMVGARMDAADSEREREVILSEREGNENRPEFRVEEELHALAFRHHPYGWDPLGYAGDMAGMPTSAVAEYYHRFYGPRNAILVVTGGFEPRSTSRWIRDRFGRVHGAESPTVVEKKEPPIRGQRRSQLTGPGSTPIVVVGWPAPAFSDPKAATALLLDQVLGGETSLFSPQPFWSRSPEHPNARLYRTLVRTGLAVRASSDYRPRLYPGLFTLHAQASPRIPIDRIEEALQGEIRRLRKDGPSSSEWADARAIIARGARLSYEGSTRAGFRLGFFAANGDLARERALLRQVLRVSRAEARAEAQRLFSDESSVTVRYEPTGGLVGA